MRARSPKISGRNDPPTNHSSSQKTRLSDLSYGIKIWTDLSSVLSQCTRLTDRQTDGRTKFSSPPPFNHASSQKTRLNDLSYGIKIWTYLSSVLSQSTHLTDSQMDGQTDRQMNGQNSHRYSTSAFHAAR